MEFYPHDLLREFSEVELDVAKPVKFSTLMASQNLVDEPINKYFNWN